MSGRIDLDCFGQFLSQVIVWDDSMWILEWTDLSEAEKARACRSVAAQRAHFVQRESFHALDYVVMHCDNSATFAFLNHNTHFFT